MFEYPMDKYKYYICESQRKIIAVSTYEGKTVRGVAKADPRDLFDLEKGKQLAAARCNQKIAAKRKVRADRELKKAVTAFAKAQDRMMKMNEYYEDARAAAKNANMHVDKLLSRM